jgi:uncharacterized membrane protein
MTEMHKRTFVRTVSYRLLAVGITAIFTGLSDAILIHIILTAVHYVFERIWLKVDWGNSGSGIVRSKCDTCKTKIKT